MYVHLKQSGNLLGDMDQPGGMWLPDGVRNTYEKIAAAYERQEELNIEGLMVISGAGNVIRGETLKEYGIGGEYADFMGRLATMQNTVVVSEALRAHGVPTAVFIADTMEIKDGSIQEGDFTAYEIEAVQEAYKERRVVLIAGGTGEDDKTTDNAVMEYARRQQALTPDADILILKGTKYDGVFEGDPKLDVTARRYARISAQIMLEDHARYRVVDKPSLQQIIDTGIPLVIYRDGQHDLATVIGEGGAGTLVVAEPGIAEFADAA
jgi:uridylate kinase